MNGAVLPMDTAACMPDGLPVGQDCSLQEMCSSIDGTLVRR